MSSDKNIPKEGTIIIKGKGSCKSLLVMLLMAGLILWELTGCASGIGSIAEQPPASAECPEGDLECIEIKLRESTYY